MLDISPSAPAPFALDADQIAMRDMAKGFADENFAPNAIAWDEARHFPVAEMRKAAALGMGGIFIAEEFGGSELSRLTGTLIFEALATGCPTVAAYMSIHNMTAWLIDAFGNDEQRGRFLPRAPTQRRFRPAPRATASIIFSTARSSSSPAPAQATSIS
jgi:alkylation response protein AidB-like acyl-CoA dehydrogenase